MDSHFIDDSVLKHFHRLFCLYMNATASASACPHLLAWTFARPNEKHSYIAEFMQETVEDTKVMQKWKNN